MTSLDNTSIREEVARLKADFKQLSRQNQITPETGALFKSLLFIVELILSILLERQTRKTSKNSSLPPSQTDKDETNLSRTATSSTSQTSSQTVTNHRHVESCELYGSPLDSVECISAMSDVPKSTSSSSRSSSMWIRR